MLKLKLGGYQHTKHSALHFDFLLCSRLSTVIPLTLKKLIKKPPKPKPLPGQAEATSSHGLRSLDKQFSLPGEALSDFKHPTIRLILSRTDVT